MIDKYFYTYQYIVMKKSVLNIVFYLICFIVLLLFSAIFFNFKRLEGFREGVDNQNTPACTLMKSKYIIIGDASMNVYLKNPEQNIFTSNSIYQLTSTQNVDTNQLAHFAINMSVNGIDYIDANTRSQLYFYPTESVNNATGIARGEFCFSNINRTKYAVIPDGMSKGLGIQVPTSDRPKGYGIVFVKDENGKVSVAMKDLLFKNPTPQDPIALRAAFSILHAVCETRDGYKNIIV
jgi:hypothetical protein